MEAFPYKLNTRVYEKEPVIILYTRYTVIYQNPVFLYMLHTQRYLWRSRSTHKEIVKKYLA